MAWGGTLTNMTDVANELVLDAGFSKGWHETDPLDLDAKNGGGVCWRQIEIRVVVNENPAATGKPTFTVEINVNNGVAWSGWNIFQPGVYYCDEINVRTTVCGDPATGQRPKIISQDIDAPPADSCPNPGNVLSFVGALPGAPTFGDRHVLTTDGSVNVCVDAQTPAWRKIPGWKGMEVYDENLSKKMFYDGTDWLDYDLRKNCNSPHSLPGWSTATEPQGAWSLTMNANQIHGGFYTNGPGAANLDNVTYQVCLSIGTYTLELMTYTTLSSGVVDVDFISPAAVTTEHASWDLYSNPAVFNVKNRQAAIAVTEHGLFTITFRVDGQNGLSAGFDIHLTHWSLWRTA